MCLLERIEPLEIHGINEGPWLRAHEGHMIPLGTYVVSGRLHEEADAADARAHSRRKRHKYTFFQILQIHALRSALLRSAHAETQSYSSSCEPWASPGQNQKNVYLLFNCICVSCVLNFYCYLLMIIQSLLQGL